MSTDPSATFDAILFAFQALQASTLFKAFEIFLGVYALVLLIDVILLVALRDMKSDLMKALYGAKRPIVSQGKTEKRWSDILARLESGNPSQYKAAVLEADAFADEMLKGIGYAGTNMKERLAQMKDGEVLAAEQLKAALLHGVAGSFNVLDVDGCTSTNDTVLLLASGLAGPVDQAALEGAVADACRSLAEQMCGDAEGATKVVRFTVTGAADDAEALTGARYVSRSNLVKCSWYGCDPYWGRIASDLGSCGIEFDPASFSLSYGGVTVCESAVDTDHDSAAVAAHMAGRHLEIVADLGVGTGTATILTNDLSHAYIDENMGTS